MKLDATPRQFAIVVTMATLFAVSTHAEDAALESTPPKARPTRAELRDKQYDVSLDAREIERILTRLKRASELSKQRITEAAESAEGVAGVIDRDPVTARARAEETAKKFQEIAKLLEALLTEETPQKIAAARNIAAQLAKAEQQLAQQTQAMATMMQSPETTGGGKGQPDPKQPPNPKASQGQGGNRPQDPTENPQGGTNGNKTPAENPDGKPVDKGDKEDADKPQGTGNEAGKPMPVEALEESGGAGKKDEDENAERKTGGGGTADDKVKPSDEEQRGGGGKKEQRPLTEAERAEQLAGRAEDLAARAETLLDILESIAQSELPEDKTAAEKVTALLKETDLKNAVAAMQAAADQVRNQKLEDVQATARDIADRLQITTQRLDAVYRGLVGPQAEELRKLEQQLLQLRTKLDDLQTPAQVIAWHRAVAELLEKAEELGISEKRREDLLEEMKKNGFNLSNVPNIANIQLTDGRYAAPQTYHARLIEFQEEIQSRIQSLVLGDFASMTDDLAPPKYQGLVERYYQVLSREGTSSSGNKPAAAKEKK